MWPYLFEAPPKWGYLPRVDCLLSRLIVKSRKLSSYFILTRLFDQVSSRLNWFCPLFQVDWYSSLRLIVKSWDPFVQTSKTIQVCRVERGLVRRSMASRAIIFFNHKLSRNASKVDCYFFLLVLLCWKHHHDHSINSLMPSYCLENLTCSQRVVRQDLLAVSSRRLFRGQLVPKSTVYFASGLWLARDALALDLVRSQVLYIFDGARQQREPCTHAPSSPSNKCRSIDRLCSFLLTNDWIGSSMTKVRCHQRSWFIVRGGDVWEIWRERPWEA